MGLTKTKIIILIIIFNCYLLLSLFFGQNTILNFFSYKTEYAKLEQQNQDLIKQRYQLGKISSILANNKNTDAEDVLDEFLRNTTQSSLPEEKIVIIKD